MNRSRASRGRGVALAFVLAGSLLAARSSLDAAPTARAPEPVTITERDVALSNEKVRRAYGDMVAMWRDGFAELGERFAAPRLARYRGAVRTVCGAMSPGNAGYCTLDNTIYYDEVFVAGLGKRAAEALGTDGDMTSLGVIAHETGHAVAIQLGYQSRFTYENEAIADCLAGAFAHHADRAGALEPGDEEEAFFGMSMAGDPTPPYTGNARRDRALRTRLALMGHGTREQRMANFREGLRGGAGACLEEFK